MKFDSLVRGKRYSKSLKKVFKNIKAMIKKKVVIKRSCKHSTKSSQHTSDQINVENLALKKHKMQTNAKVTNLKIN